MGKKSRQIEPAPATRAWWPFALIALAGLAAYANSFSGDFVFDDISSIETNPFLRRLWPPWDAMLRSPGLPTRPIPYLTFALNYAFGGNDPWGYHAVNLAIHLAAASALFEIVRRSLEIVNRRWRGEWPATGLALAVALIWVTHPIQTQAVTYIYQRLESLMGMFLLLTLLTFLIAMQSAANRRGWWLAVSVLCCGLGMASKEVMVVVPLVVLWYDRVFIASTWRELARERWPYYLSLFATWGVLGLVFWNQRENYAELDTQLHTRTEYFFTQPTVVWWYLRLLVWPQGQCLDYGWEIASHFEYALPPFFAMLILLGGTVWLMWRHPPLGFVAGSFFFILSVTSSVLVVADLANEHRMYVPSAAAITLLVLATYAGLTWLGRHANLPAWMPAALLTGVTLVLIVLTHQRNKVYEDYLTMWENVVANAGFHTRAYQILIKDYVGRGEPDKAVEVCREQLARTPESSIVRSMLADALLLARRIDEAEAEYRKVAADDENLEDAEYGLGLIAAERGNHEQAIAHFRRAIELLPRYQRAHHALGKSLALQRKTEEAKQCFYKAIEINRYSTEAMVDLAVILDFEGRSDEALALFREYLQVHENHFTSWDNLGLICLDKQRYDEAIEAFGQALPLEPGNLDVRRSLARALAGAGRLDDAAGVLRQGVRLAKQGGQPQAAERMAADLAKVEQALAQAGRGSVNRPLPNPAP
ncbi:MAG: tetratricopeptide repeat protein [Pirellulaceae bacterium]|nr:tetratricopeptide repeat protein [Pirellulaceae bacterium]